MQLLVRTLRGCTAAVDAEPWDTIDDVKARLKAAEGVPIEDQILVHCSKQIQAGRSLQDAGVSAGATLHMTSRLRGGKPVKVKMLTNHLPCGPEVTIDIEQDATKDEIKAKLEVATGVPAAQQKVMLSGINQIVMGDKRTNLGYSACGSTNGVQMAVGGK